MPFKIAKTYQEAGNDQGASDEDLGDGVDDPHVVDKGVEFTN